MEKPVFSYKNATFSQGIIGAGKYLYESNGKMGIDVIYKIDIEKAFKTKNIFKSTIQIFDAPAKMIEDLTIKNGFLYTSDENSFFLVTVHRLL